MQTGAPTERRPARALRGFTAAPVALLVAACGGAGGAGTGDADDGETLQVATVVTEGELTPAAAFGAVPASQPAVVVQRLAQAEISVTYSRPVARGREIFGNLVGWGDDWNPGADHATYLRTTADIVFGGQPLPTGRYSVWARPGPDEWTLLLHHDWDVMHIPFPGEEGVALELTVAPERADHMETLAFYFPVADRRTGELAFHWGETRFRVPIEVPEP